MADYIDMITDDPEEVIQLQFFFIRLGVEFAQSIKETVPILGTHPDDVAPWLDRMLELARDNDSDEAGMFCACSDMLKTIHARQ